MYYLLNGKKDFGFLEKFGLDVVPILKGIPGLKGIPDINGVAKSIQGVASGIQGVTPNLKEVAKNIPVTSWGDQWNSIKETAQNAAKVVKSAALHPADTIAKII